MLTRHDGTRRFTCLGNSFAAPVITAHVYNIIRDNPAIDLNGIRQELRQGACCKKAASYDKNTYDYSPKAKRFILKDEIQIKGIDIPIIQINGSVTRIVEIQKKLVKYFKGDGYNAIAVSGGYKKLEYSLDIISVFPDLDNLDIISYEALRKLYDLYDPDLRKYPLHFAPYID